MTDDAYPLFIWSDTRPTPEQMTRLKEAKSEANITYLIQQPARATPGCGRVLSFQGRPPFACEWAETSWEDPQLGRKLNWAATGLDGKPHGMLEWMQGIFGPETTQLEDVGRVMFK